MAIIKTLIFILIFTFVAFGQLTVSAPETTAPTYGKAFVPITVTDASNIVAFQFLLNYDPDVLTPAGSNFGCSIGDLAAGFTVFCNESPTGTLRVAAYSAYGFSGSGTILNVKFATHTGATYVEFDDVYMFDSAGPVDVTEHNGAITLK